MARVYAVEDGDLTQSIRVTRKEKYKDVNLGFLNRESTNDTRTDVLKVTDAAAVKQSVRNILTTGRGEKPFAPLFGSDLGYLLFELDAEFDEDIIEDEIKETLAQYEPRADVQAVSIDVNGEQNSAKCVVTFKVVNTDIVVDEEIDITRLR
jgi:phage baseplate assembly protein W